MNSNPITQNAIEHLNHEKQALAVDQAGAKITYILREQESIRGFQERITELQKSVNLLADEGLTAEQVFGRPASFSPSPGEATVLKAIRERNEWRQRQLEASSHEKLDAIYGLNSSIAGCNARIDALRLELGEIEASVITEGQLLA